MKRARAIRYTVLAVGEGATEEAFLRHLKSLVGHRGQRRITIDNAKGGGPGYAIDDARKKKAYRPSSKVIVWVDGDRIHSEAELQWLTGRLGVYAVG